MNKKLKIAILGLLILSACNQQGPTQPPAQQPKEETTTQETVNVDEPAELTADFEPTIGGIDKQGDGPWKMRMLLATSTDGLNFTRSNIVLADQANTPSIVVDKNGLIYIYYSDIPLEKNKYWSSGNFSRQRKTGFINTSRYMMVIRLKVELIQMLKF